MPATTCRPRSRTPPRTATSCTNCSRASPRSGWHARWPPAGGHGMPSARPRTATRRCASSPIGGATRVRPPTRSSSITRRAIAGAVDATLRMDDREFEFAGLRFAVSVDEPRRELDLEVQHPAFPALDEQTRAQVGFIALDTILGEEEVERWIGSLSWSASAPTATVTADGLRAEVERLRAASPRASGHCSAATASSPSPRARCARSTIPTSIYCASSRRVPSTTTSRRSRTTSRRPRGRLRRAGVPRRERHQGEMRTAFVYIDGDTPTSRELETGRPGAATRRASASIPPGKLSATFASQVAHWQTACAEHIWADLPNLLQGPYTAIRSVHDGPAATAHGRAHRPRRSDRSPSTRR